VSNFYFHWKKLQQSINSYKQKHFTFILILRRPIGLLLFCLVSWLSFCLNRRKLWFNNISLCSIFFPLCLLSSGTILSNFTIPATIKVIQIG
jgi:hypothetical protein